jgi:glycosyltransferase involved in cell wall biosynthesis
VRISIHTVAKDAIRLDFHLVEMIKHHLDFADEIVVMEGFSSDGTFEAIRCLGDKVKIFRKQWTQTDSYCDFVNVGLSFCTGDWCIKLDADEFIPEWEWGKLRSLLEETNDLIIPIHLRNFYGSYKVEHVNPKRLAWPEFKWCIHPNRKDIRFWGDGSNASVGQQPIEYGRSMQDIEVHHFGTVRDAARLREKWRTQAIRNQRHTGKYRNRRRIFPLPKWVFDLFPYRWLEPDILEDLRIYPGPFMGIVEKNPREFVRDGFLTYEYLEKLKR